MIHEIVHVLGFSNENFKYYPINMTVVDYLNGLITLESVINHAIDYFNCSNIRGLAIELKGDNDI